MFYVHILQSIEISEHFYWLEGWCEAPGCRISQKKAPERGQYFNEDNFPNGHHTHNLDNLMP